jgi:transposase, IS5 family
MLREHYPSDKLFEEILGYVPTFLLNWRRSMSIWKMRNLYRLIKKDLSQRRPKTTQTGRNSTPVEVILRMLVVKRLYGYSYEETERQVSDSLSLRQFCRVYLNAVPDDTTLIRWANLIQPKTLEKFNERIVQLAIERKVTRGRKMRTDGTVVESNVRPPSDGRLLSDSVRVLARTVVRGQTMLKTVGKKVLDEFEDFTQTAKGLSRKIGETLRSKKKEAQEAGRQQYEKLMEMTEKTIDWAVQTQSNCRNDLNAVQSAW